MRTHLTSFGYICAPNGNIADFMLDVLASFVVSENSEQVDLARLLGEVRIPESCNPQEGGDRILREQGEYIGVLVEAEDMGRILVSILEDILCLL